MTVPLPYTAVPPAAGWRMIDWRELELTSTPAAGGVATIELPQLDDGQLWLIDRMVSSSTSTTATELRLYVNGTAHPTKLRTGTRTGNFDEADYPTGLLVRPSTFLLARWTGASAGALAYLTVQAREFRKG